MSQLGCEIEVETQNGTLGTFYFDCEKASYFNEYLENTSGSTIYLYKYKNVGVGGFNPIITIQNYRLPSYRATQNTTAIELSNATGTFNTYANFWHYYPMIRIGLTFLIMFACLVSVIRKGN